MINVYSDAATEGANGRLGSITHVGLGVYIPSEKISIAKRVEGGSNNEGEFLALILAMETCIEKGFKIATFHMDSRIVCNRARGYKPSHKYKNGRMDRLQYQVLALSMKFDECIFIWINRDKNYKADELSKKALNKVYRT